MKTILLTRLRPFTEPYKRVLPLGGVLVLSLLFALPLEHASAQEAQPEQQLAQITSAIAKIEDWLNSAANNRTTQEKDLRRITQQIGTIRAQIETNKNKIEELSELRVTLTMRTDALQTQKLLYESQLKSALRASYKSGQESYLKLLLNQEDPALSARMLHYFGIFNRERSEQIRGFRETLEQIAQAQIDTENTNREIAEKQSSLQTSDIASRSGELEQLQQDRQRLEELIEQINEAIANIPAPDQLTPFAAAKGSMPLPVAGRISNRFGASYSDGNLHRQGLILVAEQGTPVRSIHPGRVVFADWLRGSGLLVVVDHGEGYLSLYANNESLVKRKGDWVNKGEPLATAGSDGGAGEAGIYFEIRHNSTAQDPLQWCSN